MIAAGYNEDVLPFAWLSLISGLAGIEIEIEELLPESYIKDSALDETKKVVKEVKANLKGYKWCFD